MAWTYFALRLKKIKPLRKEWALRRPALEQLEVP